MRARRTPIAAVWGLALQLAIFGVSGLLAGALVSGCASDPGSSSSSAGLTHTVRKGDNLYRISQRYGVPVEAIREANQISDVTSLRVGQQLWIPTGDSPHPASTVPGRLRQQVLSEFGMDFGWPVRGKLTSRYGQRGRSGHDGIDIGAPRGTDILATEAGKVIHVGRMGDYGKIVVVKHEGDFRSVYAHVNKFHVREGNFVEKGERIAEVGTTGNASGPHLHFEIRERDRPRDPILYLP